MGSPNNNLDFGSLFGFAGKMLAPALTPAIMATGELLNRLPKIDIGGPYVPSNYVPNKTVNGPSPILKPIVPAKPSIISKITPPAPGAFMNTAGYNSGHSPAVTKPVTTPKIVPKVVPPVTPSVMTNSEIAARSLFLQSEHVSAVPEDIKIPRQGWLEDGSSGGTPSGGSSGASPVKTATPDIITIDQETLPADLMTSLIFENVGGQELISISRHDLISGSNMDFQSIKNLNEIYLNHNSLNIIPMPDSAMVYEKNFPISWASHIVEDFSSLDSTHIAIDLVAKELQIFVANMKPGEQIEVEVLSSINEYNYTNGSYPVSV
jgi:hypothetical protein